MTYPWQDVIYFYYIDIIVNYSLLEHYFVLFASYNTVDFYDRSQGKTGIAASQCTL